MLTVKGINNYQLEGSEAGAWIFKVKDKNNLVTESIIEQLKGFKNSIYFNDLSGKHWIFDFKIDNIWFEASKIDCCNMEMVLNAYN